MESVKDYNDEFCIEKIQTLSEEAEPAVKNFSFPFRNMGAENQTEFWDIDSALRPEASAAACASASISS